MSFSGPEHLQRWITARSFVPGRLSQIIWRVADAASPTLSQRYLDHLVRAAMRALCIAPRAGDAPIALLGAFALDIGIGRAAQILRSGLEVAGLPVHPMDCSTVLRRLPGPRPALPAAPASGTLVFCVNPPEIGAVLRRFGPDICAGKRLVGYWWWELDRLPREWVRWAALMDEIWVSSHFVHAIFTRALPGKPVRYVPLPVPEPVPSAAGRADFGLEAGRFTVLVAFDLSSGVVRKNPEGAIAAFRRAFPDSGPDPGQAQLVLKVGGAERHPDLLERLRRLTAAMPNVHIIDRPLSGGDVAALLRCADVLLSLHRSEGFGLFIAEAMWLGTPVVATGWSGVLDMLDAENAMLVRCDKVPVRPSDYPWVPPGAQWAEPDVEHAAQCLRLLAADPELRRRLGARARQRAERQFSLDRFREVAPTLLRPLGADD